MNMNRLQLSDLELKRLFFVYDRLVKQYYYYLGVACWISGSW